MNSSGSLGHLTRHVSLLRMHDHLAGVPLASYKRTPSSSLCGRLLSSYFPSLASVSKTSRRSGTEVTRSAKKMSSIQRQESFDDVDFCRSDDFLEAPTLSSKEIERAREQALNVLKTKSPEEAFKIFTEVSEYKAHNPLGEKAEPVKPPESVDGMPKTAVPPTKN